ncbi:FAD-binding oxidoreductase [Bradyrhizobium lablabi]|uniref:FAD-binding oxidoreductase n=1 Tax=Bradyrhizobium lablabi TaxID=722472 RepID=UPI001BA5FB6F|nr:FAD-binding oxidoreductase [Bradyrhizobium lablabi]MBR0693584.1 FAD-binding oxidoreductase [Bradyrhizobium lablabi]
MDATRFTESDNGVLGPQICDAALLRRTVRGEVVAPGDVAYDQARKVWNGMVDRHPAAIVYCAGPDDVAAAVNFARSHSLLVAVRAGGHNIGGSSVCNDGLVIDLSRMKQIEVDPNKRTARAQAGLNLGEFDAATQAYGLATTMGVNADTGIAGLTLGGGFGKLGRKYGLSCDNLVSAEVVTADGRLLHTSAAEHSDLFWAIRGGGGNFGIVTSFEYRLFPVGPVLLAGSIAYPYERAHDAMRFYQAFASTAADELSLDAALATTPSGERVFSISACYIGPIDEGERILKPLRGYGAPIQDQIAPRSYVEIQSAGDAIFPRGRRYYWKAQFLRELSKAAIDTLLNGYATAPAESLLVLQHVGGAIARIPVDATPYANRDALYDCFPIAIWDDPGEDAMRIRWARELWDAMRPFSTGGVYANNLGEEGMERIEAAYGENYVRLLALKNKYDPTNFFRLNQNIAPTAQTTRGRAD